MPPELRDAPHTISLTATGPDTKSLSSGQVSTWVSVLTEPASGFHWYGVSWSFLHMNFCSSVQPSGSCEKLEQTHLLYGAWLRCGAKLPTHGISIQAETAGPRVLSLVARCRSRAAGTHPLPRLSVTQNNAGLALVPAAPGACPACQPAARTRDRKVPDGEGWHHQPLGCFEDAAFCKQHGKRGACWCALWGDAPRVQAEPGDSQAGGFFLTHCFIAACKHLPVVSQTARPERCSAGLAMETRSPRSKPPCC